MPKLDFHSETPQAPEKLVTRTKDMTGLDDLTHDFANSERFREYCLAKYGQYFKDGQRFTR